MSACEHNAAEIRALTNAAATQDHSAGTPAVGPKGNDVTPAPAAAPDVVQVPREPTEEMIQAWHDRMIEGASYVSRNSIEYALYVECYKAMLAAAELGKDD